MNGLMNNSVADQNYLTEHCKNSLILFRWRDELPVFVS